MTGMKVTDILSGSLDKLKQVYTTYIARTPQKAETFQASGDAPTDASANQLSPEEIATQERNALIIQIVIITIFTIWAILVASVVTNHMIMYPFVIRLLIFPLTLTVCLVNPLILFGIMAYYAMFLLGRAYFNTSREPNDKLPLMPYMYTFWPLSTHRYETTLMRILTFPFTYYPGDEKDNMTTTYTIFMESIRSSFPNFEETMKIGGFAELYTKFKNTLNDRQSYTILDEAGNPVKRTPISVDVINAT
jgi:hypothetical protein